MMPKSSNGTNKTLSNQSETETVRYLYYGGLDFGNVIGGVLPGWTSYYSEYPSPDSQFGIEINFMDLSMEGRYEFLSLQQLQVTQTGIHVAGTSNLECERTNVRVEGDAAAASCSVTISSDNNFQPVMTWVNKDGQALPATLRKFEDWQYTKWTLDYNFNIKGEDYNNSFSCLLSFRYVGPVLPDFDTSDPAYGDSCSVAFTDYEFSVRDTTITPGSENTPEGEVAVHVGDELVCSARGSEPVFYEWRLIQGNSYRTENYTNTSIPIRVTTDMVGSTLNIYQCSTQNYVLGVLHEDHAIVKFVAVHGSGVYIPPEPVTVGLINSYVLIPCTRHPVSLATTNGWWHVQWLAKFSGQSTTNIIYSATQSTAGVVNRWRDKFEAGENSYDLVVSSATADMAGSYSCYTTQYPDSQVWPTELVLVSQPLCTGPENAKAGQLVEMYCAVDYHGISQFQPHLQWYKGSTPVYTSTTSSNGVPESIRNMKWQRFAFTMSKEIEEETFHCKVQFWPSEDYTYSSGKTLGCDYQLKFN